MNVCTTSGLSSLGTSLGLSQTTGYSPYMPLLALVIATKWFHFCHINASLPFITADWFLILVALLTIIDLIVDLIPGVSTGWHMVHTAITPLIGGFITAATAPTLSSLLGNGAVTSSVLPAHMALVFLATNIHISPLISTILLFIVGFLLTGIVHLHRTGGRAVANVGHVFTLGASNVVISMLENVVAFVSILLSFFAPAIMLFIVICVVLFTVLTFRFVIRGFRFFTRQLQSSRL